MDPDLAAVGPDALGWVDPAAALGHTRFLEEVTRVALALGLGQDPPVVPMTIAALVAIGVTLTLSPVVYQAVEKIQGVMVALIMLFVIVAIPVATTGEAWGALVTEGVGDIGFPLGRGGLGIALLLALWAVAFLGSTPIGGPIAGFVSQHLGGRAGLALGAAACLVAAALTAHVARRGPEGPSVA